MTGSATLRLEAAPPRPVQLSLQLESFEGPLELLLNLVEARRLPITRVSLAQVAGQYLSHLHALPEMDPDLLSSFLVIGGRLLFLKSRALLQTDEPDPEMEETADELEQRLATYRLVRDAAALLRELEQRDHRSYLGQRPPLPAREAPLAPLEPRDLAGALARLVANTPRPVAEIALTPRASVDERRALVLDVLRSSPAVSFRKIAGHSVDEVIATFLAILELFRRGLVRVRQAEAFGDVLLERPDPTPQAAARRPAPVG